MKAPKFDWYFKPKTKGDSIREPIQGEFFATDAISDAGTALVREGIQNSLDASSDDGRVMVRILVSGAECAAKTGELLEQLFSSAWSHYHADDNGLRKEDLPSQSSPCQFIVFEDFGTSGLEGDPQQAFRPRDHSENNFYHFFRAEGQSDKGGDNIGSWGVGKHVFPRSSLVSTWFGTTVRASDSKRLLMGKAVLKSHYVGEDYCQEGYYGLVPPVANELVMPIEDEPAISEFCKLFDLQRGNAAGLSVVIPWSDEEVTEAAIVRAVIRDYSYRILSGKLEVMIEAPKIKTVLDSTSLLEELARIGGDLEMELRPLVALSDWAAKLKDADRLVLKAQAADRAWEWSDSLFPAGSIEGMRKNFLSGERCAVRIPVTVRKKGSKPVQSWFDVVFERDHTYQQGKPLFMRRGITIPNVNAPRTRGVRAIVTAEDEGISKFLRDAENPSHTEWQHDGSNFHRRYQSGRRDLLFVERSVHEIVRTLTESDNEEDRDLLADFFSLPDDEGALSKGLKPKPKGPDITKPDPPLAAAAQIIVNEIAGGFSLSLGNGEQKLPLYLNVQVAYDLRRGNALKNYRTSDFELNKQPVVLNTEGVEVLRNVGNQMLVKIEKHGFRFRASGFDKNRDLYVKVTAQEAGDGD
jgi:hypothetical protein